MRGKRALRKETAERKGHYPPIPKGKRKQKKEKFFTSVQAPPAKDLRPGRKKFYKILILPPRLTRY